MLRLIARFVGFRFGCSQCPTTVLLSPSFNQGRSALRLYVGILRRDTSRESKKLRRKQSPYLIHADHNHENIFILFL